MKYIASLLAITLQLVPVYAQFGPQKAISTFSDVWRPSFAHSSDMDSDGDLDLLVGSIEFANPELGWYENLDGFGTWSQIRYIRQIDFDSLHRIWSFQATDMDGDGDDDILYQSLRSSAGGEDRVAWVENINGHDFGEEIIIPMETRPDRVLASDMDSDGDKDIIYYDSPGKLAWIENVNDFSVTAPEILISTSASSLSLLKSVDIDQDGDYDILASLENGDRIIMYENSDGLGTFSSEIVISELVDNTSSIQASDIDGDGDLDIVSTSSSDGKLAWYEHNQQGKSFGLQQEIFKLDFGALYAIPLDIDGDMDQDLVFSERNGLWWFENIDARGTFRGRVIAPMVVARIVVAADFDADGDPDIVSVSNDDKIALFENIDGQGSFGDQSLISTVGDLNGLYSVNTADIDGDGDADVVFSTTDEIKVAWFKNIDGKGSFDGYEIVSQRTAFPTYGQGVNIEPSDVDGDGDIDIVYSSGQNNEHVISWYENINGRGDFGPEIIISTSLEGIISLKTGDFDGDGDQDVVAGSRSGNSVYWYINTDGFGTYSEGILIPHVSQDVSTVHVEDIDQDGDLDILTGYWRGGGDFAIDTGISWFENIDGLGSFGNEIRLSDDVRGPSSFGTQSIETADVDGDGIVDILYAYDNTHASGPEFLRHLDGLGTFERGATSWWVSGTITNIATIDFDLDGDIDVVTAGDNVSVSENIGGDVVFPSPGSIISRKVDFVRSLAVADLDTDGYEDVISLSWGDKKIAWYQNISTKSTSIESPQTRQGVLELDIYPNPFSSVANIVVRVGQPQQVRIEVYDILGRSVKRLHTGILQSNSPYRFTLDGTRLSSGLYFIQIRGEEIFSNERVLLIK